MTLEHLNEKVYDFLEIYRLILIKEVPEFREFKLYTGIMDKNVFCILMAELHDGTENRVLRVTCSSTDNTSGELVSTMFKFFKETFISNILFTDNVTDLILKGDLYSLKEEE